MLDYSCRDGLWEGGNGDPKGLDAELFERIKKLSNQIRLILSNVSLLFLFSNLA